MKQRQVHYSTFKHQNDLILWINQPKEFEELLLNSFKNRFNIVSSRSSVKFKTISTSDVRRCALLSHVLEVKECLMSTDANKSPSLDGIGTFFS